MLETYGEMLTGRWSYQKDKETNQMAKTSSRRLTRKYWREAYIHTTYHKDIEEQIRTRWRAEKKERTVSARYRRTGQMRWRAMARKLPYSGSFFHDETETRKGGHSSFCKACIHVDVRRRRREAQTLGAFPHACGRGGELAGAHQTTRNKTKPSKYKSTR